MPDTRSQLGELSHARCVIRGTGLAACNVSVPLSVQSQAKTQAEKDANCVLTVEDPSSGSFGDIHYAGQLEPKDHLLSQPGTPSAS